MVREIVNFSSFWRSSTFSSTVDPTIYLLAFGFGFGSLVTASPATLHRLRRHGDRGDDGAVLRRVPGMYSTFVKYQFQHTYDAILAAP